MTNDESAARIQRLIPFVIVLGLPLIGGSVGHYLIQQGWSILDAYLIAGTITMSLVAGAMITVFRSLGGEPNAC